MNLMLEGKIMMRSTFLRFMFMKAVWQTNNLDDYSSIIDFFSLDINLTKFCFCLQITTSSTLPNSV